MIPTCCPRQRARVFSELPLSSSAPKITRPLLGRSMPVSMWSRVDLPLPDGPLMTNRLKAGTLNVTSSRMAVFWVRVAMTRDRCSTRINGLPCANGADGLDAVVCPRDDFLLCIIYDLLQGGLTPGPSP